MLWCRLWFVFLFISNFYCIAQARQKELKNTIIVPDSVPAINDSSLLPDKYGVYREPKKLPSFPGGTKALGKYLAKHLKWPKTGLDVQGKVIITFIVEKNGILSHFTIVKKLYPTFDEEALRVIKKMPKWIPGRVNGKPVRSYYSQPIYFNIFNAWNMK